MLIQGRKTKMHYTQWISRALPGLLLALLFFFGQAIAVPSPPASTNAALGSVNRIHDGIGACSSPHQPQAGEHTLGEAIDRDDERNPPAKHLGLYPDVHTIIATGMGAHPLPAPATTDNAYRLTPLYLLTERLRL